jgi:hypothetical protein
VEHEEPVPHSEARLWASYDAEFKLRGYGRRRKSATTPGQAALQARWRLNRSVPNSRPWPGKKRQVLFEKTPESLGRIRETPSVDIHTHGSRWWRRPEPRLDYDTRNTGMPREGSVHRGQFSRRR